MTRPPHEHARPDVGAAMSLAELSQACDISIADLRELLDYGAIAPMSAPGVEDMYAVEWLARLRRVTRLRCDFDLDLFTTALVLGYLKRIEELEEDIRALQARMPARLHPSSKREGPAPWREPHG